MNIFAREYIFGMNIMLIFFPQVVCIISDDITNFVSLMVVCIQSIVETCSPTFKQFVN